MNKRTISTILSLTLLTGCAGAQRSCTNWSAESFGADWLVVQLDMNGHPFSCWKLKNTSIANEDKSDGIHWQDNRTGHMVHISGWYNRVQVANSDFDGAAKILGVDAKKCSEGVYEGYSSKT